MVSVQWQWKGLSFTSHCIVISLLFILLILFHEYPRSGLFINDLSMHDYSRDIMLATTQEKIQMKMLLTAAENKAAELDTQKKKLAEVMKKSDDLISQMLPKSIADDLAKGKTNEEICKAYDCVTMLFSDIVTFTVICSKLKPLQV